jgi:acetyltransferase
MFSPKSIAIIGASGNRNKFSAVPLFRLRESGYQGGVYPVNPKYKEIAGYPCFKDIESLPKHIDLAIIAIKASEVISALEKLAERSVRSVVVFSNGFSEIGDAGKKAQQQLSEFVLRTGIPVCGPNSLGLFNLQEGVLATVIVL